MRNVLSHEMYELFYSQVAPLLKERMMAAGTMMITYTPLGDKPNFLRVVMSSHDVTKEDMDFVVTEIRRLGHDL